MPLLCIMALATLGVLIAWRWEIVGGAIAVISAVSISGIAYLASGGAALSAALIISVPYFVAGLLFLTCCWSGRRAQLRQSA